VTPLCIDLFAGMFGFSAGWLELGGRVIGFDIEHLPHHGPVPASAELVLQDVRTLDGAQFKNASLILASPPCQAYSYRAMPWKRAKALPPPSNELFDACFRIQSEASEAAGHHIPLIVENVKGAQPWVGRAKAHFGSFYLWGDVPAIMPWVGNKRMKSQIPAKGVKCPGNDTFKITGQPCGKLTDPRYPSGGIKQPGHSGRAWFADPDVAGHLSSKSSARKAVSAQIAKIPEVLSRHIARSYWP